VNCLVLLHSANGHFWSTVPAYLIGYHRTSPLYHLSRSSICESRLCYFDTHVNTYLCVWS